MYQAFHFVFDATLVRGPTRDKIDSAPARKYSELIKPLRLLTSEVRKRIDGNALSSYVLEHKYHRLKMQLATRS